MNKILRAIKKNGGTITHGVLRQRAGFGCHLLAFKEAIDALLRAGKITKTGTIRFPKYALQRVARRDPTPDGLRWCIENGDRE